MKKILLPILAAFIVSGCSDMPPRSIPVEYHNGNVQSLHVDNLSSVAVTQWKDSRILNTPSSDLGEKTVIRNSATGFGITSQGKEFVRVADFVRSAFVQELRAQGVNVKSLDIIPASSDSNVLENIAKNTQADLLISGDLMAFDVSCHGVWPSPTGCQQKILISLNMIDQNGKALMVRELFESIAVNDKGELSLGVPDGTLKEMTDDVLQKALGKAVKRTIDVINQAKKK